MRTEEELICVAGQLKVRLIKRATNMEEMISRQSKSDAGLIKRLNPEVYNTITTDLNQLKELNIRDSVIYATLRWALGVTENIDYDNLELDE